MADGIPDVEVRRRSAAMKALGDDDRRAAIAPSPNVVGFGRFSAAGRQRDLADGYRRPRS